jgi:uncharacterized protein
MQMIERPWGVAVHGAASVKAAPDVVTVRFKVIRVELDPSRAFAQATEAVHVIREVLRRHGLPDTAVEASRLGLSSSYSYGATREFLGYACQAGFSVQSRDLDGVQQLLVDVVEAGAHEIEGIEFDVAGRADLRAEARGQAVAAARAKAELYAQAAGIRLGPVVHIDDLDTENTAPMHFRSSAQAAGGEDLAPGHIVVSAAVNLGFAILPD